VAGPYLLWRRLEQSQNQQSQTNKKLVRTKTGVLKCVSIYQRRRRTSSEAGKMRSPAAILYAENPTAQERNVHHMLESAGGRSS
jgi:hypothetical protein